MRDLKRLSDFLMSVSNEVSTFAGSLKSSIMKEEISQEELNQKYKDIGQDLQLATDMYHKC